LNKGIYLADKKAAKNEKRRLRSFTVVAPNGQHRGRPTKMNKGASGGIRREDGRTD
jgi:hypothetical protein